MQTKITKVIFRKWRSNGEKVIIALFPEIPQDVQGIFCMSYLQQGQHGGADYYGIMRNSKRATPDEYAALKRELESPPFGYRFKVALKGSANDYQKRKEACKL